MNFEKYFESMWLSFAKILQKQHVDMSEHFMEYYYYG